MKLSHRQQEIALKILKAYYENEGKFKLPKGFHAIDLVALAGIETSLGDNTTSYPLGLFQFLKETAKDIERRILKGSPCPDFIERLRKDPLDSIDCQVQYALAYIEAMHSTWSIPGAPYDAGQQVALWWQAGGCAKKSWREVVKRGVSDPEFFCEIWGIYQNECLGVKAEPPCSRVRRFSNWRKMVVDFFGRVIVHGLAS